MSAEFVLAKLKMQWDYGDGRILLGDNRAAGWSCCGRSGSGVLQFGFQLDTLVYKYTVDDMCTQLWLAETGLVPDVPEHNNGVSRGVFPLLVKRKEKSQKYRSISVVFWAWNQPEASRIQNGGGNHPTTKIGDTRKWIKFKSRLKTDKQYVLFILLYSSTLGAGN